VINQWQQQEEKQQEEKGEREKQDFVWFISESSRKKERKWEKKWEYIHVLFVFVSVSVFFTQSCHLLLLAQQASTLQFCLCLLLFQKSLHPASGTILDQLNPQTHEWLDLPSLLTKQKQ